MRIAEVALQFRSRSASVGQSPITFGRCQSPCGHAKGENDNAKTETVEDKRIGRRFEEHRDGPF
jgi:hypothetical protein